MCLYVCMYVCIYVYTYVSMYDIYIYKYLGKITTMYGYFNVYVCINVCKILSMHKCMCVCVYVCMYCMYVRMYCMYVRMYVCMYVPVLSDCPGTETSILPEISTRRPCFSTLPEVEALRAAALQEMNSYQLYVCMYV